MAEKLIMKQPDFTLGPSKLFKITMDSVLSNCSSDRSFCIHHENIQELLSDIYKVLSDIFGSILKLFFTQI